jgi:hypothetical protein
MMCGGYLCDLAAKRIRIKADFASLHERGGDFIESELEARLIGSNAPLHIIEAVQAQAAARKILVFVPTVYMAHLMAKEFRNAQIPAEAIDGETPIDDRRATLVRFRAGETRVLINCAVFVEGYDEPSIDCVLIARPTKSKVLYTQMIGRGTRPYPGKANCLILDLVGATSRHDLLSMSALFELAADAEADSLLDEVEERDRRRRMATIAEAVEGEMVAQAVDLFRRRRLAWVVVDAMHFVLSLGSEGSVHVRRDGAVWRAEVRRPDRTATVLVETSDMTYATGAAEDLARQEGARVLLDNGARWRSQPATPKQLDTLRRWRLPVPPGLTKGDASDAISARYAQRRF